MSMSSRSSPNSASELRESPHPHPSPQNGKRKRSADNEVPEITVKKVAKRTKAKKAKPDEEDNLDLDQGLNLAIGRLDSRLLADYVAQRTKRFSADLSLVELEDRHIPERAYYDTSSWERSRRLQDIPDFLDHYSSIARGKKSLSSASKQNGSPHTLVITSAGLRAADIIRALRTYQTKGVMVAKLFAKHIKLKDAITYVKRTRMNFGVGTPSRIIDLLDSGALSVTKLEQVLIDASHIDQKKRGIFDMRETIQPLMQLLNRPELKSRYGSASGAVQLILY